MLLKKLNEVRFLVEKNRIGKAINRFGEILREFDYYKNEVSLLEKRFSALENSKIKRTISTEDFNVETNILADDILTLIDDLSSQNKAKKKGTLLTKKRFLYLSILLLAILGTVFYKYHPPSQEEILANVANPELESKKVRTDTIFTILIYPFTTSINQTDKKNAGNIHYSLASTLEKIKNIEVIVEDDFDQYMTFNQADSIGRKKEVDIVIWGHQAHLESNKDSLYLKFKYKVIEDDEYEADYLDEGQTNMVGFHYKDLLNSGLIALEINDVISWVKANQAFFNTNWQRSIKHYHDILNKSAEEVSDENYGPIYQKLGSAYQALKDYKSSKKYCLKAYDFSPEDFATNAHLGYIYFTEGSLDSAYYFTTKAINNNNDFYPAYITRGVILSAQGKEIESINDVTKAIEIKPDLFVSYINRARVYGELSKWEDALQDYDMAIKCLPPSRKTLISTYYCEKAYLLLRMAELERNKKGYNTKYVEKNLKRAKVELSIAEKLAFPVEYYANYATYYFLMGEIDKAISYLTIADLVYTQRETGGIIHSTILQRRSAALSQKKEYQQALRDINKSMEYYPNRYLLHEQRAFIYKKMGRYQESVEEMKVANSFYRGESIPNR